MNYLDVTIDSRFREQIPPLTDEERKQLEANIVEHGCLHPLTIWAGRDLLLDGHHRFEICRRLDLPFRTVEVELPDREAAEDWIDKNQLGRRNLTPDQASLLRGRRYNRMKKAVPNPDGRNQYEVGAQNAHQPKTAEILAVEHGVNQATIRRDGQFAESVDVLKAVDPEIERKVIAGGGPTKRAVVEAAKLAKRSPRKARTILEGREPRKKSVTKKMRPRIIELFDKLWSLVERPMIQVSVIEIKHVVKELRPLVQALVERETQKENKT